ncbi:hypothetical protein [Pseudomonas sp. TWI929]|uniref:hypothetical protein n=1 Tax=Pseudomonas sp. TWI929 TaxID=3136795 RepID=UPI00320BA5FC
MKKLITLARQRLGRSKPSVQPQQAVSDDTASKLANAVEQLQGRDRVGIVGEGAVVAGSVAAGAAAAGTVATAAGATTLLGSTTLAGALGGVFVTTTPVGWVVGTAALAGMAGYGLVKLVRSGSKQDVVRERYTALLSAQLQGLQAAGQQSDASALDALMAQAVACAALDAGKAQSLAALVKAGRVPEPVAIERVRALLDAHSHVSTD